jgi:hypothetical protein
VTTAEFFFSRELSGPSSRRAARFLVLVLCCSAITGCGSTQDLVPQQQKALTSLRSTVTAVCSAWLEGDVSTTYARTALEATAALLEKERTQIAGSPDALADPALTSLSESENQLARQIALLRKALVDSDATAVRQLKSAVSSRQAQLP